MTNKENTLKTDLVILGAGLTGLAAALFATNRGIPCVLAGQSMGTGFASGLMDLLGGVGGERWEDPWAGIETLRKEMPNHPYAKLKNDEIHKAFQEVHGFLNDQGLSYRMADSSKNVDVITSIGSIKKSYMVPEQMWNGVIALEKKASTLLIDFEGLKIFSGKQIASSLSLEWPGIRVKRIEFPGTAHLEEVHGEHLARSLDLSGNRVALAERIRPFIKDADYIGFPAVLGMYRSSEVAKEMEELLGLPVFEIPMPPVSVPGIRLKETFFKGLEDRGSFHSLSKTITRVETLSNQEVRVTLGTGEDETIVEAKGMLLATGRFLGKGLTAQRTGIKESLLDLPIYQPQGRDLWHRQGLFDVQGHPVNSAGIETDLMFRPVDGSTKPVSENLFSAGSILAHNDWTRMKSGAGVAISTAYAAVNAFAVNFHF